MTDWLAGYLASCLGRWLAEFLPFCRHGRMAAWMATCLDDDNFMSIIDFIPVFNSYECITDMDPVMSCMECKATIALFEVYVMFH